MDLALKFLTPHPRLLIDLPIYDLVRLAHCLGMMRAELGNKVRAVQLLEDTLRQSDSTDNDAINESLKMKQCSPEEF